MIRRTFGFALLCSIVQSSTLSAAVTPHRIDWRDLPARVSGHLVPLDKLGVVACPTDWALRAPDRRVLQIIENVLYGWEERDLGARPGESYCVVMLRPFERPLSPAEAQVLLTASSLWLKQAAAPGARPAQPSLPADDPRFRRAPSQFRGDPSLDPSLDRTSDLGVAGWAGGGRTGAHEERGPRRTTGGDLIGDSVIGGTDDRARVTNTQAYPHRAIGFLNSSGGRATAFVVSPYAALTNGHVVWNDRNREFSSNLEVAPGQFESGGQVFSPYGRRTAVRLATNPGWVATGKIQYDYGATFFDQPFSGLSTFMPLAFDVKPAVGAEVRVAGYPGSVRGTATQSQWLDADKVVSVLGRLLRYKVDTSPGNSGSPVWQVLPGGQVRAIAVHSTGDLTNSGNSAARLVAENFELIAEWLAWTPFQRNGLHLNINQMDAAACPLVQANVSVTNDTGQPVLDLTRANFSLTENGVPQTIDVEQAEVSDQAISVALILDASTSLSDTDVANIKSASRRFIDLLGPRDRVAIIFFSDGVTVVQNYTTDKARAKAAVDTLDQIGSTALFDAILEGVQLSTTVTGRRALVAMTDGMNNTGELDPNVPIAAALAASVPVFTIGFGSVDVNVLDSIATSTGGRFFLGGNSADLQSILAAIGRTFDKQYLITWLSPFRSGGQQNLEISVADGAEGDTRDTTYSQSGTLGCPAPNATCRAEILSPNGGETWNKGQPRKITWSTIGPSCGPTVGLAVSDGTETWYLADVPDNGMRSFDIDFLPPGNLYRAIVADRATGQSDTSDDPFTIAALRFTCRPNAETLCLLHGRFQVRVVWRPPVGPGGFAKATVIGDGTGIFRFADPTSAEIGLRMFDSRAANGHFSFFSGAATNFEYSIFVTDTVTGQTQVYSNPAGEFRSFADDTAFGPPTERQTLAESPSAPPTRVSRSTAVGRVDPRAALAPPLFAPPPAGQKVLWDQSGRTGTVVISSEHRLDPGASPFDTEGADDFVVPAGKTWMLDGVDVVGDYYGQGQLGPADSVDVQVFADRNGLPGTVTCSYLGLHPVRGLANGDFEVNLPSPCRVLTGRSWVTVQAAIDFNAANQWGWAERQPVRERASAWRNPGAGYLTLCNDWGRRSADCGIGENPDFAYRLRGRDSTGGGSGNCQATSRALCFANRKVKVEVTFRSENGRLNPATARTLATLPTSGYFSFGATGLDVMVKIIDGSTINGNLWVFFGGLSSLEFTVKVTDVTTGRVRTYTSPKGRYTSAGDFAALPGF
jgi:VWFA-related protein